MLDAPGIGRAKDIFAALVLIFGFFGIMNRCDEFY
jgi:hypothetical protein